MFLRKFFLPFFVLWLGFTTPLLWPAAAGVPDQEEAKSLDDVPAHQPEKYYDFVFEQKAGDKVRFSEKLVDLSDLLKEAAHKEEHGGFKIILDSSNFRGFSLQEIHDLLQSASENKLREYYKHEKDPKKNDEMVSHLVKIADLLNFLGARDALDQITYALAQPFIAHENPADIKKDIMKYEQQIVPDIQRLIVAHIFALKPANLFPPDFLNNREASIIANNSKIFKSLPAYVNSVSWSPDGQHLASGLEDKTVQIWDLATGELEKTLIGHTDVVYSVSWSPDGKQLASGSVDKTIRIWDVASAQVKKILEGHTNEVVSVSWSPDGQRLASGSSDKTIRIWNVATWQLERILEGHTYSVTSVSWSPNSKQLASGSYDKTIRIWDVATWQLKKTLKRHTDGVASVSWSPDSMQLASGSYDETIRIWNVATEKVKKTLKGHARQVDSVSWSPNGKQLASGSYDSTIRIWDVAMWQLKITLKGHIYGVNSISWSPDGKQLASGSSDKTIRIWNIDAIEKALKKMNNLTFKELIGLVQHT